MASVQSVHNPPRASQNRDVARDEATIAFDSMMSAAVSVPAVSSFVVFTDSGEDAPQAQLAPKKDGDLDSIADLSPSQQAILKMMSSPPRGQDPLGMMAEVEHDLHSAGVHEAEVEQAEAGEVDVRSEVKPESRRSEPSGTPHSIEMDEGDWQSTSGAESATRSPRSVPEAAPRGFDVVRLSDHAVRAGQGTAITAASAGLASIVRPVATTSSAVTAIAIGGGSGAASTATASAISAVPETALAGDRLQGRDVRVQGKPVEGGAGSERVQAQALRGVIAALRNKGDAVTVVLRPEALGKVRVDLRFGASGVRGMLTCSTDSACDLLKRQVDGLQHALEARGIVVERLEVVHDPRIDPDPGTGSAAGGREDGRASEQRDTSHAGGGRQDHEHVADTDLPDQDQTVLILHDPAFCWDGSRLALSTLA